MLIKHMKRPVALLLALTLVFTLCIIGIIPIAAAATADDLAAIIVSQPGLTAEVSGAEVTVGGTLSGSTSAYNLDIPSGVIVNWSAALSGTVRGAFLMNLTGGGVFNFISGTVANNGTGGQINVDGAGMEVNIIGTLSSAANGISLNIAANDVVVNVTGTINNSGTNSTINVGNNLTGVEVNVSGSVLSTISDGVTTTGASGYAINDGGGASGVNYSNNTRIMVSAGGRVESGNACAIRSSGLASVVTVDGGTVRNAAASNTNSTIYMNGGTGDNVIISGGLVETTNTGISSYVVQTTGNVLMTGGTVTAINGRAINLVGVNSVAAVSGGTVQTVNGTGVCTATTDPTTVADAKIIISGDAVVKATGNGTAVRITGARSTATISDSAQVTAKQGLAVDASGSPAAGSVTVNGGFVFAWGNAASKVVAPANKLNTAVGGVVVAWDTDTDTGGPYNQNSNDDLAVPAAFGGDVRWDNEPPSASNGGIRYDNGGVTGFFPLDVTVLQNTFTLTIISGKSNGVTSRSVMAGTSVSVNADVIPYNPSLGPLYMYPVNGNEFFGWTSDIGVVFDNADSPDTSFTMPAGDVTVTANLKPLYLFQVFGGYIGYLSDSTHPNYGYFPEGAYIPICRFLTYPGGQSFSGWTHGDNMFVDDISADTGEETYFTMPGGIAWVAAVPNGTPVSATKSSLTVIGGNITTTTSGVAVNAATYSGYSGTGMNITANDPPQGKEFDRWSVYPSVSGGAAFIATDPVTRFTMPSPNQDVTVTATYRDKQYMLSVNDGTGAGGYIFNQSVTVSADAEPIGRVFSGWTIDSGGGGFINDTTFIMPDSDATISAHYEFVDYNLTVIGGYDALGRGSYHFGENVTLIADDPPEDMVFCRWEISGSGAISGATVSFAMPDRDITVTAVWQATDGEVTAGIDNPAPPPDPSPGPNPTPEPEPAPGRSPAYNGDVSHVFLTDIHLAYVQGVGLGSFAPDEEMNRAQVAQMFYNLLLKKNIGISRTFPDMSEDVWYNMSVEILATMGVLLGRSDGLFHPSDPVTRAEFVSIAVRFTNEELGDRPVMEFDDVPETHWAHKSIITATSYGWIQGVSDRVFDPDRHITRAEVVALTNRLLQRIPDRGHIDTHPELVFFDDTPKTHWAYYYIEEASNPHLYHRHEQDDGEDWD